MAMLTVMPVAMDAAAVPMGPSGGGSVQNPLHTGSIRRLASNVEDNRRRAVVRGLDLDARAEDPLLAADTLSTDGFCERLMSGSACSGRFPSRCPRDE
jgi:hypothetical protein